MGLPLITLSRILAFEGDPAMWQDACDRCLCRIKLITFSRRLPPLSPDIRDHKWLG